MQEPACQEPACQGLACRGRQRGFATVPSHGSTHACPRGCHCHRPVAAQQPVLFPKHCALAVQRYLSLDLNITTCYVQPDSWKHQCWSARYCLPTGFLPFLYPAATGIQQEPHSQTRHHRIPPEAVQDVLQVSQFFALKVNFICAYIHCQKPLRLLLLVV